MKSRGRYQDSRLRSGAQGRGQINKPFREQVRTTIETRRLILRPFESSDAEAAFAWFGDAIVMRFTPTGADTLRAFAQAWTDVSIVQAALAQLPWYHNIALLNKLESPHHPPSHARQ